MLGIYFDKGRRQDFGKGQRAILDQVVRWGHSGWEEGLRPQDVV